RRKVGTRLTHIGLIELEEDAAHTSIGDLDARLKSRSRPFRRDTCPTRSRKWGSAPAKNRRAGEVHAKSGMGYLHQPRPGPDRASEWRSAPTLRPLYRW